MDHAPASPIDDLMLAAFVAGTLPPAQHQRVRSWLDRSPDACVLLFLACEAVAAVVEPDVRRCPPARARMLS